MSRITKILLAVFVSVTLICVIGYKSVTYTPIQVGQDITKIGLSSMSSDGVTKIWAPTEMEEISAYCRRVGKPIAHFFGSIKSRRSGEVLGIVDGKFSYGGYDAVTKIQNLQVLKTKTLREFVAVSDETWNVASDGPNEIEPQNKPFTGEVKLVQPGIGFNRKMIVLSVEKNIVKKVDTSFFVSTSNYHLDR